MLSNEDLDRIVRPLAEFKGLDFATATAEELIEGLTVQEIEDLLNPIVAEEEREKFGRYTLLFPDTGPLRRELYPRHLEFFAAGKDYRERLFMAANRVGKSVAGSYETTAHLTGDYPAWWQGHQFRYPVRAWAAGDTNETTRDIIQTELFGQIVAGEGGRKMFDGSGMIPRECIGQPKWKQGVQDFADHVPVLHKTGGWSVIGFKSFDQGRRSFQGTAREFIWLDEECPADVYGECLMRVATTRGKLISTFTPLLGLTELVLQFMPKDIRPSAV